MYSTCTVVHVFTKMLWILSQTTRKQVRRYNDEAVCNRNLYFNSWSRFGGFSKASDHGENEICGSLHKCGSVLANSRM